jgi:hypothetical protein
MMGVHVRVADDHVIVIGASYGQPTRLQRHTLQHLAGSIQDFDYPWGLEHVHGDRLPVVSL